MYSSQKVRPRPMRALIVSGLVFAVLVALIVALLGDVSAREQTHQMELVRDGVKRAAITCYAVEGRYPQNLDYLRKHYGLLFDQSRYQVTYDAFASNIMPQIWVTERGQGE